MSCFIQPIWILVIVLYSHFGIYDFFQTASLESTNQFGIYYALYTVIKNASDRGHVDLKCSKGSFSVTLVEEIQHKRGSENVENKDVANKCKSHCWDSHSSMVQFGSLWEHLKSLGVDSEVTLGSLGGDFGRLRPHVRQFSELPVPLLRQV